MLPSYVIANGLRSVSPYEHTYTAHAKKRWQGRRILDVMEEEFYQGAAGYYKAAIEHATLLVNGEKVSHDYIVKNGDFISHKVHKHEPFVLSQDIEIIHRTKDYLVVDKPPSIPMHATGRYLYNTLVKILERKTQINNLFLVHRLDRLVSGLVIIALNKQTARSLSLDLSAGNFEKVYLARVKGHFPQKAVCEQRIKLVSAKLGVCAVSSSGKECVTEFTALKYLENESIVACAPRTGRTHQIRVHLLYLGHPISNDPTYSQSIFPKKNHEYSPQELAKILDKIKAKMDAILAPQKTLLIHGEGPKGLCQECLQNVPRFGKTGVVNAGPNNKGGDIDHNTDDNTAVDTDDNTDVYTGNAANMFIYLHSWMYSLRGETFESRTPHWFPN